MSEPAEYLIVQHVPNLLRRESHNVGVIVVNGDVAASFIGEVGETGEIDGRSVRSVAHPSVYRKWVKYWREQLSKDKESLIERLTSTNGENYNIIPGGSVTDVGEDSAKTICENLFALLVSKEGSLPVEAVTDATTVEEVEADALLPSRALEADIANVFRQRRIMSGHTTPTVKHPVWHNMPVAGKKTSHIPQFSQQNDRLYVMESVNFLTPQRMPAKHHAGYIAKMFDDIAAKDNSVERIAIVRASPQDMTEDKTVRYSLELLEDSARIVKWLDVNDRDYFVAERERIAFGNGLAGMDR